MGVAAFRPVNRDSGCWTESEGVYEYQVIRCLLLLSCRSWSLVAGTRKAATRLLVNGFCLWFLFLLADTLGVVLSSTFHFRISSGGKS